MTNYARVERHLLADLFLEVGPDAPTLCGDWTTSDLAAHLVVREHRPDAAVGIVVPPLAGHGEHVRLSAKAKPWPALVEEVRNGPPRWSPTRLDAIDQVANTVEFFVHHEDVRRGAEGWEPRRLDPDLETYLWRAVGRMGRLLARKAPGGLVLAGPEGQTARLKKGEPAVTVRGPVGELVLFAYGRQAHSRVELEGPADLAEATRTAHLGG